MVNFSSQAEIVQDVHARDILLHLVKEGVTSESDFEWLKQQRFYLDSSGNCVVRQLRTSVSYGYEYIG